MRHFLQYWKSEQADANAGNILEHSASAQFDRVGGGDCVWICTVRDGRLSLLGRIVIAAILNEESARKRFNDVYDAPYHVVAVKDTERPAKETDITTIASKLRFRSVHDRLSLKDGRVDGKQLQSIRELTPEAANLLSRAMGLPFEKLKNAIWSRDELILALDLYLRHRPAKIGPRHAEVRELSAVLREMGRVLGRSGNDTYRNPNGVAMKLGNFLTHDPSYGGKGLPRGNREEVEVWNEFAQHPTELARVATAIKANINSLEDEDPSTEVGDEEEFAEGQVLFRVHRMRERNRSVVTKAKEAFRGKHGRLFCEVCLFDYSEKYGELGGDFIECHHQIAVADLRPGQNTRIKDLAMLCANCHRMVHRRKPWLPIAELVKILQKARATHY